MDIVDMVKATLFFVHYYTVSTCLYVFLGKGGSILTIPSCCLQVRRLRNWMKGKQFFLGGSGFIGSG
jgi:hypothetical protein